ncbi:uncharacterized protein LOC113470266 [Diaphorina citri]|uniref:Uncharacterized protein LOC113470266 n=1 Tax=Diaphorina citri TaxID=121845 RepID=A0A3Q0J7B6_DIACI|nr:uncharacterized protein LOC113470266 [Diaphorina citri]
MDRKYVAFGQIVEGMGVLDQIESIPTYYESPRKNIEILNCGLLPLKPTSEDEVKSHDLISENQIFPDVPSLSFYDIKSVPDESDETFLQRDFKKLIVDHFNQLPLPVLDKVHPSDVPSDHLLLDRYAKGLYSLPTEYQAFVQTTREHSCHPGKTVTVPCQPNAIPGGPSSADPRQYYSLRGSGNPPIYAGLSPEELQGKTDRELLRLFDVPPGLDGISQENMSRLSDDLGRLVMEALSKEIRVTGGSKEGRGNEKEKRRNEDILGDAPSENVLGDDENEESKENVVMVTESKQNEEIQERK